MSARVERPDLKGYRASIAECCGSAARERFCESFGCCSIAELVAYAQQLEQDAAGARSARELFVGLTKYLHHGPGCDSMATLLGDCACGLRGRLQAALLAAAS